MTNSSLPVEDLTDKQVFVFSSVDATLSVTSHVEYAEPTLNEVAKQICDFIRAAGFHRVEDVVFKIDDGAEISSAD